MQQLFIVFEILLSSPISSYSFSFPLCFLAFHHLFAFLLPHFLDCTVHNVFSVSLKATFLALLNKQEKCLHVLLQSIFFLQFGIMDFVLVLIPFRLQNLHYKAAAQPIHCLVLLCIILKVSVLSFVLNLIAFSQNVSPFCSDYFELSLGAKMLATFYSFWLPADVTNIFLFQSVKPLLKLVVSGKSIRFPICMGGKCFIQY